MQRLRRPSECVFHQNANCSHSSLSRQAVKQIANTFKPYMSVQRISQIWRHIQEIQGELRTKIDADWDKLYALPPPNHYPNISTQTTKLCSGPCQTCQSSNHGCRLSSYGCSWARHPRAVCRSLCCVGTERISAHIQGYGRGRPVRQRVNSLWVVQAPHANPRDGNREGVPGRLACRMASHREIRGNHEVL